MTYLFSFIAIALGLGNILWCRRMNRRIDQALAKQRVPMGYIEIKLDTQELLKGIREIQDEGEEWKESL